MTFSPTIPAANDLLSTSQGDIQTNFSQSNSIFGVNHVNFDNSLPVVGTLGYLTTLADEGKHTIIQTKMINDATAAPTAGTNEGVFYVKETSSGGRQEPFYRYPNAAAAGNHLIMQLSYIKAWVRFNGSTLAITDSFNVTSVTRPGGVPSGSWNINFTEDLANTDYLVFPIASNGAAPNTATYSTNLAVGSCRIVASISDYTLIQVLVIGS